ncbi:MAG: 3'-5' exonuclease, partial [Bacteroidota bacterium]
MGRLLDKIIVVDVEATCWEGQQPKDQSSEIIEIGICMIDLQSMTIEDNEGILILPQNSVVSDFCTQLTTITQGILEEDGISFQEACEMLRDKYNSKKRVWASYGAYDLNMFQSQ